MKECHLQRDMNAANCAGNETRNRTRLIAKLVEGF